jgi:hypothetical protein
MYTVENDITEPLNDGSGVKVIFKTGTQIAWATAIALGLVTGDEPVKPPIRKPLIKPDASNDHD